ncbi:MAG TPA: hypothetical protein VF544_16815 [Pyrinomonadaceae bacterium]|jgi:hypothetical protein
MCWSKAALLHFLLLISLSVAVKAQTEWTRLGPGQSVERTITRGKTQSFTVNLEREQLLQLVVEQQGVDLVVRVFSPDGRGLGQFDSPNGTEGPENVSVVAEATGVYRIDVLPLEQEENSVSGRYVIRVEAVRQATGEELEAIRNRGAVKARGTALVVETAENLRTIRLPETRVRLQVQAATLLADTDGKLARRLLDEAIEGVKEYLENVDTDDDNYYQSYQTAMELRNEVVTALVPRNPELALTFLRSTRTLANPNESEPDRESQLELSIASQIAAKDSKRALRVAEESLKRGYSYNLLDTLSRLQTTDAEAAAKLAGEIYAKLQTADLLKNQEAANLLVNFLQLVRNSIPNRTPGAAETPRPGLLSEQEYKTLLGKALSTALNYTPPATQAYSPERNVAQYLLSALKSISAEIEHYAPERAAAVEKKAAELNAPTDQQSALFQKYQETINNNPFEAAQEAIARAPQEMREQLYAQLAQKALSAGDSARARQILTENIRNPVQRRQALKNLEQQAIYNALNSGKIDEALRSIANIASPRERAVMLTQVVNRFQMTQKKEAMLKLLDQARELTGGGTRAEDQEQMNALFQIAHAYMRFDPKRGFEIVEPLVGQFNEMGEAAVALNGFGQEFFRQGELVMQNGNMLGVIASQLTATLATLSAADFDRARAAADRLQRPEVRLFAYLTIAQSAVNQRSNEGVGHFSNMRQVDY